ncbi:MAG: hypothetical protein AAF667_03485 [Pseudomonadota bacterium]
MATLNAPWGPAWATICSFDQICVDAEPCAAAPLKIVLTEGTRPGEVQLTSVEGAVVMRLGRSDFGGFLLGFSERAVHVLTTNDGRDARYTKHHFEGPVAVTHLGACDWDG